MAKKTTRKPRESNPQKEELDRQLLEKLMFFSGSGRRYTQDSPVLPDVWIEFFKDPSKPQRLLLTPDRETTPGKVAVEVRERLKQKWAVCGKRHTAPHEVIYNRSTVSLCVRFDELVRVILPLTNWWFEHVQSKDSKFKLRELEDPDGSASLARALTEPNPVPENTPKLRDDVRLTSGLIWVTRLAGTIAIRFFDPDSRVGVPDSFAEWQRAVDSLAKLVRGLPNDDRSSAAPESRIFGISLDREATPSVSRSVMAIKADAARQLFGARCDRLAWAVIDSGIDARHPAFRVVEDGRPCADELNTRVKASYDFSRLRGLLDPERMTVKHLREVVGKEHWSDELQQQMEDLKRHLQQGRLLDWGLLEPFLQIRHDETYKTPEHDHGTHVAGILGGFWLEEDPAAQSDAPNADGGRGPAAFRVHLQGVCPDIKLYDLRVLDAQGQGDEFTVIAALQFVRHLNGQRDSMVLHGANLSLSILHDVANFACGRTPVCEECDRLTATGVVVVAAAGNNGYERVQTAEGIREGYHSVSITDPGNADSVITVGATHRYKPHTYGVSYFSSRGPTGDGRLKPDLVAPGEKITAPLPGEKEGAKDGTSMAAPHVSGAAALLMARHTELVGHPARIKQIVKDTATDLGRERYFQGEGMLDVLRALQSI